MPAPLKRGTHTPIPPLTSRAAPTASGHGHTTRRAVRGFRSARARWNANLWRAKHEANRPSSTARGYDRRWQKLREAVLAHQPECNICGTAAATEVDHIIPHKGDASLFHDRTNLQGLCKPCHSAKTRMGQ